MARLWKQPIELIFNDPVTLADCFFQLLPVQDLNVASDVTDRPGILQPTGSHSNAFPSHTQHVGNEFLGHDQFIGLHAVVA